MKSYKEIGEELGVSSSRANQLATQAFSWIARQQARSAEDMFFIRDAFIAMKPSQQIFFRPDDDEQVARDLWSGTQKAYFWLYKNYAIPPGFLIERELRKQILVKTLNELTAKQTTEEEVAA